MQTNFKISLLKNINKNNKNNTSDYIRPNLIKLCNLSVIMPEYFIKK